MMRTVVHFGGNGHAAARLESAREALARKEPSIHLKEVTYPGFEGRLPAEGREAFLETLAEFCRSYEEVTVAAYATGIGALFALALRARGTLRIPLILQGPVLWGLEYRWFPRVMQVRLARELLHWLFQRKFFQRSFARKYFRRPLEDSVRDLFFDGYGRCAAFGELFVWFDRAWLRETERAFSGRPEALQGITVWLGGYDRVVGPEEVRRTEEALECHWPWVVFPTWGHYPMIDVPEEWADALIHALARPEAIS